MQNATLTFGKGVNVIFGNRRAHAATMTIALGESEGGPDNRHRGADQWRAASPPAQPDRPAQRC